MNFYKILQEIMNEKGLTVADTARLCGLTDSTVRSIISRQQQNVALEVAFKLSDGLGVSLERLNGKPLSVKSDGFDLSPFEKDLIIAYRKSQMKEAVCTLLGISPEERKEQDA